MCNPLSIGGGASTVVSVGSQIKIGLAFYSHVANSSWGPLEMHERPFDVTFLCTQAYPFSSISLGTLPLRASSEPFLFQQPQSYFPGLSSSSPSTLPHRSRSP